MQATEGFSACASARTTKPSKYVSMDFDTSCGDRQVTTVLELGVLRCGLMLPEIAYALALKPDGGSFKATVKYISESAATSMALFSD